MHVSAEARDSMAECLYLSDGPRGRSMPGALNIMFIDTFIAASLGGVKKHRFILGLDGCPVNVSIRMLL